MTRYQYITIQDVPQDLEIILDPQHPICKTMDAERKLATNAPDLKLALEDISRVERTAQGAVTMARLAENALLKLSGQ
jgi:hypothetical protein